MEAGGARRIQFGTSTDYRLPSGVVVRISRPEHRSGARREIEAARWLTESGIPAMEAVPHVRQPVDVHGRTVTFWLDPPPHEHGTLGDVATVLRRLHELPPPTSFTLGRFQPFLGLAHEIETTRVFGPADRRWLTEHLNQLRSRWQTLPPGRPWCVIHGEAWDGEFAATVDDRVILLNAENLAIGPPEWDLVPTAVEYLSFGWITAAEYARFCDVYRQDVLRWGGFYLMRDILELRMTMAAARAAAENPAHRDQARLRLRCIRGDEGPRQWPGWVPLP
ncbi:phosphotransferase family protein [Nocardia veterana]|nr:phosphotransferase [Nocardia veterana]